jgi:competence protein ComEC
VKTITPTVFEIVCYYLLAWALLSLTQSDQNPSAKQIADLKLTSGNPETTDDKNFITGLKSSFGFFAKAIVADVLIHLKWSQKVMSRRKFAGLVAIVVIFGLTGDICYWLYNRFWHRDLRVTVIDVGQGNAALLELPGGYNILIDGGGFSDNSVFDVGARVVAPLLWRKKIRTVNTLVLSHANSDHLNGLIYIAEHFNVQTIWTNNEGNHTIGYQKFMEIVASKNIQAPEFRNLPRKQSINGVDLSIIYPQKNFLDKKVAENWRNLNNNSLVIRISFGSTAFLFPGDIMAEAERELVHISENAITSAVLLAPHHGSSSSSTNLFLDKVDADVVIISSGWQNRAGFPHAAVLQSYRDRGLRIFRTDTNGAITLITDGQQLLIKPFMAEAKRHDV